MVCCYFCQRLLRPRVTPSSGELRGFRLTSSSDLVKKGDGLSGSVEQQLKLFWPQTVDKMALAIEDHYLRLHELCVYSDNFVGAILRLILLGVDCGRKTAKEEENDRK